MRKILVISNAYFRSGAESSLSQFLSHFDDTKFQIFLITSDKSDNTCFDNLPKVEIMHMPLEWFCFTLNPVKLAKFLYSLIAVSCKLAKIINKYNIEIIYSNTIKSHIYGTCLKLITRKKLIWHIRDNVGRNVLSTLFIKCSDKIICVSQYIYDQVKAPLSKKKVIYGGEDIDVRVTNCICLKKELKLPVDTKLVAQVGQLTRWKNNLDFIQVAYVIAQQMTSVHFLLVGDDLSGKELKYKVQLEEKVKELDLSNCFTFLGHRENIREIISQVDVLVHTAIGEPFGRVIIEAMALEKPVVAYNSGGPSEIILDGKTGFLVQPFQVCSLAEKTTDLLKNEGLRNLLGKNGRERVMKEFNMNRSVNKIEELFLSV